MSPDERWPLPDGWAWGTVECNALVVPAWLPWFVYRRSDGFPVWIDVRGLCQGQCQGQSPGNEAAQPIPLGVVRELLHRWRASQ